MKADLKLENLIDSTDVVKDCYRELSKYTMRTRTYHSMTDGLKSVYRRVIYASLKYNSKVKSASIVGDAIKYHPHGDASIYSALVSMTSKYSCKVPLYEGKGNFGGLGFEAAAMRYTEASLSSVGRLLVGEDLIEYADYIEGESGYSEPVALPMYIPYVLLNGGAGFGVGMPNPEIPSFDVLDLISIYKDLLNNGKTNIVPKIDSGDCVIKVDSSIKEHDDVIMHGGGRVTYQGIILTEGDNRFVISELPPFVSIDRVLRKVNKYLDEESLAYIDESTDRTRYVFEIDNPSKLKKEVLIDLLRKGTTSSVTYKMIFEDDSKAYVANPIIVIRKNLSYLTKLVVRKFDNHVKKTKALLDILNAIEDLKKKDLSKLPFMSKQDLIDLVVSLGYTESVGKEVTKRPISYLSKSHQEEIKSLRDDLIKYKEYKSKPSTYLLERYGELQKIFEELYKNERHTIVTNDITSVGSLTRGKVTSDSFSVVGKGYKSTINWLNKVYLVDDKGFSYVKYVTDRVPTTYTIKELGTSKLVGASSDSYKYLIIIEDDNSIYVKQTDQIKDGSLVLNLTGRITNVIATSSEKVTFIGSNRSKKTVKLVDYMRSRRGSSFKIMNGKETIKDAELL